MLHCFIEDKRDNPEKDHVFRVELFSITPDEEQLCWIRQSRRSRHLSWKPGGMRLELYDSILTTEFGTPLFLIQQPSLDLDIPMTIQGANLAVANTSVLLERQSSNDVNQTSQTTVRQILAQQRANAYPDWFQVRRVTDNPEWANSQTPPPDKSLFLIDIQDFAVDNYSDSSLGFDRNRIEESTNLP